MPIQVTCVCGWVGSQDTLFTSGSTKACPACKAAFTAFPMSLHLVRDPVDHLTASCLKHGFRLIYEPEGYYLIIASFIGDEFVPFRENGFSKALGKDATQKACAVVVRDIAPRTAIVRIDNAVKMLLGFIDP